ncbi:MAG: flagellar export chaperone FliS [Proteobacteria bacterium]|nr:flagellar export chaperone FliS [Pseudomonadota bacterium]MBU1612759.1 flagellar export chaperone FliS [Pseudomonadota bacterium]
MSKAANAYLTTQVTTTSQGQLLVLLYDAGIKFLKQAKEYMIAKDYAKKGILISRAMDIITELACSLNKDKGGQIAENLQSLYTFCNIRLAQANMKMEPNKIDDVINILSNIRDAYAQILPQVEGEASAKAVSASNQANMAANITQIAMRQKMGTMPQPAAPTMQYAPPTSPVQTEPTQQAPQAPTAEPQTSPAAEPVTAQPVAAPIVAAPVIPTPKKPPVNMAKHRAANAYTNNI